MPEGRVPVSLKVIGVSPLAVTEKVPAVFSAKLVEAADVNTGALAVTVRVKDCVAVFELTSVAVMVIGYAPAVPKPGAPERVPPLARVTPDGSGPVSLKLIGVSPVAVTEKVPAVFSEKLVGVAGVNPGPVAVTVRVKDCVEVFELASVAVMVIG